MGYSPRGRKESDTTERLHFHLDSKKIKTVNPKWEDPLEKEIAIHSSILAWRSPWAEEPGGLQPTGSQRVGHD